MENFDKTSHRWNAEVFNVGCGYTKTIKELAETISNDVIYIERPTGETFTNLSDNSKFKDVFGWFPTVDVVDWIVANLKVKK
jgi:nucleoside-diphosphate-sugar epimerase